MGILKFAIVAIPRLAACAGRWEGSALNDLDTEASGWKGFKDAIVKVLDIECARPAEKNCICSHDS